MTTSTTVIRWRIPPQVWMILLTWGVAVVVLAGLFTYALYRQQQTAERRAVEQRAAAEELERRQDRAMCALIDSLITDDPIPAGPAGDRIREGRAKMLDYRATLRACPPRT